MKLKTVLAGLLAVAFVSPALAATEFYVVQDVQTKKCKVVQQKPTTTTNA